MKWRCCAKLSGFAFAVAINFLVCVPSGKHQAYCLPLLVVLPATLVVTLHNLNRHSCRFVLGPATLRSRIASLVMPSNLVATRVTLVVTFSKLSRKRKLGSKVVQGVFDAFKRSIADTHPATPCDNCCESYCAALCRFSDHNFSVMHTYNVARDTNDGNIACSVKRLFSPLCMSLL